MTKPTSPKCPACDGLFSIRRLAFASTPSRVYCDLCGARLRVMIPKKVIGVFVVLRLAPLAGFLVSLNVLDLDNPVNFIAPGVTFVAADRLLALWGAKYVLRFPLRVVQLSGDLGSK